MDSPFGSGRPIRCDIPGSYSWTVIQDRHPALIEQVLAAHPYPPARRRAIEDLGREITGVVEPLTDDAPDAVQWATWSAGYLGRSWHDLPFLWAENYFYRKLLSATGYLTPGPWFGIDPFAPAKAAELADPQVDDELAALDGLARLDVGAREQALILAALWGNRADLGFLLQARGPAGGSAAGSAGGSAAGERVEALVADDRARLSELLAAAGPDGGPGRVVVLADNAGRELLPDLILIDHLLAAGRAAEVVLHLKPRPYFVSDATTADLLAALRRMTGAGPAAAEVGRRLASALVDGRLIVRADPFSVSPLSYGELVAAASPTASPASGEGDPQPGFGGQLLADLAGAKLTITKGDLNYRRLVGDRYWPATTGFAELTSYFPSPVAALRTLKSDVIVGLTPATETALDATATPWRTTGTHALIQVGGGVSGKF